MSNSQKFSCLKCGLKNEQSNKSPHLCVDCEKRESKNIELMKLKNDGWMEIAKEAEIEIWERQPAETDFEYSVWMYYRSHYPGKKPTYRRVAETIGTSTSVVSRIGQKWDFSARIQEWGRYLDKTSIEEKRQEIIKMNSQQKALANKAMEKLMSWMHTLNPEAMNIKDGVALAKVMSTIQRTAVEAVEPTPLTMSDGKNTNLKETDTTGSDAKKIMEMMMSIGAFDAVGYKQTITTEVVGKNDEED